MFQLNVPGLDAWVDAILKNRHCFVWRELLIFSGARGCNSIIFSINGFATWDYRYCEHSQISAYFGNLCIVYLK